MENSEVKSREESIVGTILKNTRRKSIVLTVAIIRISYIVYAHLGYFKNLFYSFYSYYGFAPSPEIL